MYQVYSPCYCIPTGIIPLDIEEVTQVEVTQVEVTQVEGTSQTKDTSQQTTTLITLSNMYMYISSPMSTRMGTNYVV